MASETTVPTLSHRLRRMTGRDPDEDHRAATPLELFYDLTFVVAFGAAATELAHYLAEGHVASGIWGFIFATYAVSWAWVNFSWWASAYDTDDWFVRIATLVQMVGVIILSIGIPPMFASIDHGDPLNNGTMVAGYVVMRVALLALWLRAAYQDPIRRRTNVFLAISTGIAQVGWVLLAITEPPTTMLIAVLVVLATIELGGPIYAERRIGETPWHPHHIAERFGLLVIITLGEVVFGTVTSISAIIGEQGWSPEAIAVMFGGTTLAFCLWWFYFITPAGRVLAHFRGRVFVWGYGHVLIFGSIVATGAGLHVAAYEIEGASEVGAGALALSIAIPVAILSITDFVIYSLLLKTFDRYHLPLFVLSILALVASVAAGFAGAHVWVVIGLIVLSPLVVVIGYEWRGHEHQQATLDRILGPNGSDTGAVVTGGELG